MQGAGRRPKRARRPEVDGSTLRWPGAANRFALFGEVLWVGILVVACSLPIVTLPAALAAGIRHLHRFLAAEASGVRLFLGDVRRGLPGGVAVGAAAVVLAAVLWLDVRLAASGALPGGPVVGAVGALGLVALAVALLLAASAWTPERGWRPALRSVPARFAGDPVGALYLVVALGLAAVVTWQLPPLVVPGVGCLVFAVVATGERERRTRR
ncbi:hypothetical protein GCM10009717_30120 [Agromyces allii]|uniref:DUF624 domain-containing protein n=1 Tax=Agromyces allii TaxID=393607 RepID=A0ABN2R0F5_9MICO